MLQPMIDGKSFTLILILFGAAQGGVSTQDTKVDVENLFSPSGFMGDGRAGREHVEFSAAHEGETDSGAYSIKIVYRFGSRGWAGMYWLNRADNWGDEPGDDYSGLGVTRLSFRAKGATGHEVVEFKAGDIRDQKKRYHDSFSKTLGRVRLSEEWREYTVDLSDADLSSVIGGFCWVASRDSNQGEAITFYLDDIVWE